jgi:N-acetylglucosamine-6-phosphate deacetylase
VDGIHSHPAAIRLAWDHLGPDRFLLITDGMQATGLGPGRYLLGDQTVEVTTEGPRIGGDTLAGSTLTLDRAVANLVAWSSASLDQALDAASHVPASVIGATERGRLDPGGRADLTVFDRELRVMETTVDGLEVYRVEEG